MFLIANRMIFIYQSAKTAEDANYEFSWKKVDDERLECWKSYLIEMEIYVGYDVQIVCFFCEKFIY